MKLLFLFLAIGLSTFSEGVEPPSVRDRVFQFLQKNVIGRTQTLVTDGTIASEGEDFLIDFQATIDWAKLEKTKEGLTFEETRVIKQTSTKIDKAGKPVGPPVNTDRTVVHQYALTERVTTKSLVGLVTITKNTLEDEDSTGKGSVVMIDLSPDDKTLYLFTSMAGFTEASIDGKNIVPVANATEATFFIDAKGKLQTLETVKFYKVDVNKDFARQELSRFNISASEVK